VYSPGRSRCLSRGAARRSNASPQRQGPQPLPFRFSKNRKRGRVRCRRGLGHRPTALPAQTARGVSLVSVPLVPLRAPVRYRPFASFQPLLWPRRRSADEEHPAVLECQDVIGLALEAPPLRIASPCLFCTRCLRIMIDSTPSRPNARRLGPPPGRVRSRSVQTAIGRRSRARRLLDSGQRSCLPPFCSVFCFRCIVPKGYGLLCPAGGAGRNCCPRSEMSQAS
jgi:hypothetical protein